VLVTVWRDEGPTWDDDLPGYLDESSLTPAEGAIGLQEAWDAARQMARTLLPPQGAERAAAHLRPPVGPRTSNQPTLADSSGRFFRAVAVPGCRLSAIVTAWWIAAARAGVLTVDGRLRLEPPQADAMGGWTAYGRVRRFTRWHWVPVVLELWPAHDRGTVMIMTPRRRVITSRRYFRIGNTALDRLTAQLAVNSVGELP
jgi:hypothetical protein